MYPCRGSPPWSAPLVPNDVRAPAFGPRGVRYAERFGTSCWITEARYASGSSALRDRAGGDARGNGLRHRQGSPRVDQIVPGSRRNLRCLGAHLHLRAGARSTQGGSARKRAATTIPMQTTASWGETKLGGGALPPFRTSPQGRDCAGKARARSAAPSVAEEPSPE